MHRRTILDSLPNSINPPSKRLIQKVGKLGALPWGVNVRDKFHHAVCNCGSLQFMQKLTRKEVYELIDGERRYQDGLGPDRVEPGEGHTTGEYITMLHHYMTQLDAAWTTNPGDTQALDVMRKIAGIAVHCMEDNGAPARVIEVNGFKRRV